MNKTRERPGGLEDGDRPALFLCRNRRSKTKNGHGTPKLGRPVALTAAGARHDGMAARGAGGACCIPSIAMLMLP